MSVTLMRKFDPTSPGVRGMQLMRHKDDEDVKRPKGLFKSKKRTNGRNNYGRITVRRRGGGAKRKYRIIDFKRPFSEVSGKVVAIDYDPNRSANIALVNYANGAKSYILAPNGLKVGDTIESNNKADITVGNTRQMKDIPVGTLLHNIELNPGAGGQLVRAAGVYAQLMAKEGAYVFVRLPSGELRKVNQLCKASIGQVGNIEREQISWGKAGKSRHLGRRPKVRGVAMNPIDHPHGGGEGRTSGGRHPVTPWGKPTKGKKTRNNKRTNKFILKRRAK